MSNFTEQEVLHDEPKLIDITFLIEKCASTLSFSQPLLCNEETFSLHDSMAALELMDSKMDCCELSAALVHPNNDPNLIIPPRSLPTSLDDKISKLPWNDLTIEDAAVIALESLSRLESLFRGASIAESTYTCLYAHSKVMSDMKERLWTEQFDSIQLSLNKSPDESRAAQFVVYACTLAMLEIGDVVRGIVVNADIYEEEDFSVNTNGLEYSVGSGGPEAIKVIPEALNKLSYLNEDIPRYVPILCHILEFELAFLNACLSMSKLPSCPALNVTKDAQQQSRKGVEALEKLSTFLTTTNEIQSGAQVLIKCFDPYIYRPLVGSAPVRKVVFITPQFSISTLKKVISEIDWAVCNLLISGSSLIQIRRILDYTSTSSVNILSRSLIVLNLYFDDKLLGKHFLGMLISEEILQMMNIPHYLLESKYGKAFLHRLAKPMYDTLKLRLFNRNRQRAYMEAFMFHDWACLQQESQALDLGHRQELGEHILPYFTQYTLYMIVQLMDHHIALGIELGLFCGHHDLSVAYWYRDFVLSSLLSTITSIKNSKKASIDGKPSYISHQDEFEDVEVMLIGFKRTLCRGIVRFIAALSQAKVLKPQIFEFTSYEQRFKKHFEPFQQFISPPMLFYRDYQSGSDFQGVSKNDLHLSTSECFKKCKSILEEINASLNGSMQSKIYFPIREGEILSLTKICVGNSVFLMKLMQRCQENDTSNTIVTFDFAVHKSFCTIKIT